MSFKKIYHCDVCGKEIESNIPYNGTFVELHIEGNINGSCAIEKRDDNYEYYRHVCTKNKCHEAIRKKLSKLFKK